MAVDKPARRKGHVTFRTAAAFFALSALAELAGVTVVAPLFGEFRGGLVAVVYHLIYVLLFLALAAGLWTAKPWGYRAIFAGATLYTLDKLQFLMSGNATQQFVDTVFRGQEPLLESVGPDMVMLSLTLVVLAFVLGWWGFAYYAYLRRAYFRD